MTRVDLRREAHSAASIGAFWLLTRAYTITHDPAGLLETTDDMVGLGHRIREQPVLRSRGGMSYSANYEVCAEVLKSPSATADLPERRSALEEILIGPRPRPDRIDPIFDAIIAKDGAEHTRIRKLVQPAFTHRVMQTWREAAERIATDLVDQIPAGHPVDLVDDWARPLPMAVICEILGVPFSDRARFTAWGATLASGLDRARSLRHARERDAAARAVTAYLGQLLDQRRKEPEGDLLSTLAAAEIDGDTLTDRDIVGTASFLLLAGFETTVNLLGAGTQVLMQHREQFAEVAADSELIPAMTEEALRYVSPVQFTFRNALAPIALPDGSTLDAGNTMVLLLAGANRDPEVFAEPDRFDIHRENARRHLAFGFGIHHCLGAALARMEAEVAWRQLLEHFPDISAWRPAGTPQQTAGRMIHGLRSLPVVLA